MKKILLIIGLIFLAGCAQLQEKLEARAAANGGDVSYVAPEISMADANEVAIDLSQFLSSKYPAAKTTLAFQPSMNKLHLKLIDQLMVKGFGIEYNKAATQGAVPIRYTLTTLEKGVLVRLRYGENVATRYMPRANDGHLSMANKYAVREVTK